MNKNLGFLSSVATSLFLAACGGSSSSPSSEQKPNAPLAAEEPAGDELQPAMESFLKTFASGSKEFSLKNISVEYKKTDPFGRRPKPIEWKTTCSMTKSVIVNGKFPEVSLKLDEVNCGEKYKNSELTQLYLLTSQLKYKASHVPAFPSEPNQFRLDLVSEASPYFRFKTLSSLNALTKERVLFLDLVGEEKDMWEIGAGNHHYVEVSFSESEEGNLKRLRINYIFDDRAQKQHTEISITGDLQKIH